MWPPADEGKSHEELLAEVYREFGEGLAARVETMRSALERLAGGYDADATETFYRTAHTLKGTAASFEADELIEPAKGLVDVALRWHEDGGFERKEVGDAFRLLEELKLAVRRYLERMEGDTVG